jgi:hypothetical protein
MSFDMHKAIMYFDQGSRQLHKRTKFVGVDS